MRAAYGYYRFGLKEFRRGTRHAKMLSALSHLDDEVRLAKEAIKREYGKLEREHQRSLWSIAKERVGAKMRQFFRCKAGQ